MRAVTLAEIADALGVTKQAVSTRAANESWTFDRQAVRGGHRHMFDVAELPAVIRNAIAAKNVTALQVMASAPAPAIAVQNSSELTDKQRVERDSRNGVLKAIATLQEGAKCSRAAAMTTLLTNARAGRLELSLDAMLRHARDSRGRKGDGYPSVATLKRWLAAPDLTPKMPQADMNVPAWAPSFLAHYQQPQKPSAAAAYREWIKSGPSGEIPSYHAVHRFLRKMGTVSLQRGRMGPRELKNLRPFIRRDFADLLPGDVWSADGHTFDAEVAHPTHGRPFRPEITSVIDIATRRVVGWSVDLAESSLAVLDALRNSVERTGIPAIFYVDHGSGYDNALMKSEGTGLLGRLGITVTHSLPYNSQARGVVERSHKTLWCQAAKLLPSYMGAGMDRQAKFENYKITRSAMRDVARKGGALRLMPWQAFLDFVADRVAEYNATPHRSLGGRSPDQALQQHLVNGWIPEQLAKGESETMFRPRILRTVRRGEIELHTNRYFSRALEEFNGLELAVAFDIHDATRVWVYMPDGRFITTADVDGNRRRYMPISFTDRARETRAKGRLHRNDSKREEILEELHGRPAIAAQATEQLEIGGRVFGMQELAALPPPPAPAERPKSRSELPPETNFADWLALDEAIAAGESICEDEAHWHQTYQKTPQWRALSGKGKAAA